MKRGHTNEKLHDFAHGGTLHGSGSGGAFLSEQAAAEKDDDHPERSQHQESRAPAKMLRQITGGSRARNDAQVQRDGMNAERTALGFRFVLIADEREGRRKIKALGHSKRRSQEHQ